MPNEFENEVRKKMEELNFVPSGPVWEKIEEQIRKKKDRRRGLIWFPLLGIMLAAGIWWMNEGEGRREKGEVSAVNGQEKTGNRLQPTVSDRDGGHRETLPLNSGEAKNKKVDFPGTAAQSNIIENLNPDEHLNRVVPGKSHMASTVSRSKQQAVSKMDVASAPDNKRLNGKNEDRDYVLNDQASSMSAAPAGSERRQLSFIPAGIITIRHAEHIKIIAGERNSIVRSGDSQAILPPSAKKIAARKWRLGVIAGGGLSGSGKGLSFLDGSAKMDAAPLNAPPRPPLINYYSAPTPVVQGPSFTAGFTARKQIGKKFQFITGLQYDYFSTRHDVGIRINQRSANAGVSTNFNPYYINYGATLQEYVNQYHFITLPVTVSIRPFGSLPLEWQGGLLVKRLVKTNALKYDSNIEGYYYDRSAFRNTQCYVTTGLSYAFLKQSLLAGPFMEYGLTTPEKQGDAKRLYAFGLKVQYLFTKK